MLVTRGLAAQLSLGCALTGCGTSTPPPRVAPTPPLAAAAPVRCEGAPVSPPPPDGGLFPILPPIANADPDVRTPREFRLPTRLRVRAEARLGVSWDATSLAPITLDVGCHMIVGAETTHTLVPARGPPVDWGGGLSGAGVEVGGGESWYERPAASAVLRARLVLFETDVPPQHEWSPRAGRYRVLHERTVEAAVGP